MTLYRIRSDSGTKQLRNGHVVISTDMNRWRAALYGHRKSAHRGQRDEKCAACREIESRVEGAK